MSLKLWIGSWVRATQRWNVLWFLILRDIKVRYKAPWLGIVWAFAVPFVVSVVLMVVFGRFLPVFETPGGFFLFVMTAMFPWNFFQLSVSTATTSIQENAELIKNVTIPRMTLPMAIVGAHGFNFLCALLVLSLFVGLMRGIGPWILLLPGAVILQGCFTLGVVLIVATLQSSYRDVKYLVEVGLWLWFYLTPVFYPMTLVSYMSGGMFPTLYLANPMVSLVSLFRIAMLGPEGAMALEGMTVGGCFAVALVGALAMLIIGCLLFRWYEPALADLIQ